MRTTSIDSTRLSGIHCLRGNSFGDVSLVKITNAPGEDWITEHRAVWERKSGLREYYATQMFDRIITEMRQGPTLQLGAGPGFFSRYHPGMVNSDISDNDGVDVIVDVHDLKFNDGHFCNIVGIDVLHHFAKPGLALNECARALRSGGRLVLIEPWAGPLGTLFFKYVHHEACEQVLDPWNDAFPDSKDPMEGNAAIPKTVLYNQAAEMGNRVPDLQLLKIETFGCLSVLLTGGFQRVGLPAPIIRTCASLENLMPKKLMDFFALRAIFVLEKKCV
jgi:SAM-dependent methyltransferase